jgi:6-phosphogluconolactonase/glucosamine-6-phosphate isomerase/deaminase
MVVFKFTACNKQSKHRAQSRPRPSPMNRDLNIIVFIGTNGHIGNIFDEHELNPESVVRNFRITAADGKSYDTKGFSGDGQEN